MKIAARLSIGYYLGIGFLSVIYGLGLILHFFVNNKVFPRFLDDEGLTTRKGRRYLWADLVNWERHRTVVGGLCVGRDVLLNFKDGKVVVGSRLANLDELLDFLSKKLGTTVTTG